MAAPQFHELTISNIRPQTGQGTALRFSLPENLKETFRFTPGQYLTLRATVDGNDIRRSYSICSAIQDDGLEIGIKRVRGGAFSNYAMTLKRGDTVQVMAPQGRFTAAVGGQHNYLFIAAGSGITPCLSIIKSVLKEEPLSTVTLIYGNSRISSVMFRQDLNDLKDLYTDRFTLIHALSRERQDVDLFFGRIDATMIKNLVQRGLVALDTCDTAFLCGPQEMTREAEKALKALGMAPDRIKTELFATATQPGSTPPLQTRTGEKAETALDEDGGVEVSVILDGTQNSITVDPASETVLAAAQRAGLDVPYSCAGGMCCTCRCKIVSGEAEMDVNYSLQDWEIKAGFTLACQTRPTSDSLELDFDAA